MHFVVFANIGFSFLCNFLYLKICSLFFLHQSKNFFNLVFCGFFYFLLSFLLFSLNF